ADAAVLTSAVVGVAVVVGFFAADFFLAVDFFLAAGFLLASSFCFAAARAAFAAALASRAAVSASTSPDFVTLKSRSSSAPQPQHRRDLGRRSRRPPHSGQGRSFSGGFPTAQSQSG